MAEILLKLVLNTNQSIDFRAATCQMQKIVHLLEKRDYIGNNMLSWSVFVTHRFSNLVVLPHIRPDVRCTVMVELN